LFTSDSRVISLTAQAIPFSAAMQFWDGIGTAAHGLLRGIGKQSIGGPANIFAYYCISLPISLALAFKLNWKIEGLWAGITVGIVV
jgi:multidrug resistance protein, MATE family